MTRFRALRLVATITVGVWCLARVQAAPVSQKPAQKPFTREARLETIRRAQVWMPIRIPSMDLKAGPKDPEGFASGGTVACDFVKHSRGNGATPKFWCATPLDDEIKVRYRERNGHVYAQVAATRLLWALGFGADRAYPVKVLCRNCPPDPWASLEKPQGEPQSILFDPATIDRKMPGNTLETKPDQGWAWKELDLVDEAAGGAPLAQRDALKLLAVFIQHTDTKSGNQRLICLDKRLGKPDNGECAHPFMMIPDLGTTFGHANAFNRDGPGSVNFQNWSQTPIWRNEKKGNGNCIGNLPGSVSGTLDNPPVSEAGRKFLADLLVQLSDTQLHDLFEVARFTRRDPKASIEDWVQAFKRKRDEIVNRTCSS
ncbi:MAG TPA: hypothetical protein VGZ27_03720 [Vicinamibacterales bacterium]|nr:hypothetical protein [Vicinamibacterales bacterium]